MRYLFAVPGAQRRVMHIEEHTPTGEQTNRPLCGRVDLHFNRTINAPFGLGRPVCRWCEAAASGRGSTHG